MRALAAANGAAPTCSTTIKGRSTVVAPDADPTTNIAGNKTALVVTMSGSASPAIWTAVQIRGERSQLLSSDRPEQQEAAGDLAEPHHPERRRGNGELDTAVDEQRDEIGGGRDHRRLFEQHRAA